MKITILDGHALNPGDLSWKSLKNLGELTVYDRTDAKDVISRIGNSDAILLNKICITEEILSACPTLRYIGVQATGYNVIDIEACKRHNVTVTNVPSYSTMGVAQLTFSYILDFATQARLHSESVFAGDWTKAKDFCYWNTPLTELDGKVLGIFGYGNIGKRVSLIAKSFGMHVIVCTRTPHPEADKMVDFDTLLTQSDIITLHAPLTTETKGIINATSINKMKTGAWLINTARGAFVNEADVTAALKSRKLAHYAADVISEEPMNTSNPLLFAPKERTILTPHIAWAAVETRQRLLDIVVKNLQCFAEGRPQNVVA